MNHVLYKQTLKFSLIKLESHDIAEHQVENHIYTAKTYRDISTERFHGGIVDGLSHITIYMRFQIIFDKRQHEV